MRSRKLLLASASPRRRYLLEAVGLDVEARATHVAEAREPAELPDEMVQRLAREKAWHIDVDEGRPVVAADTAVVLIDEVLGKPDSDEAAAGMLQRLSGNEHAVLTGYCIRYRGQERCGVVRTQVWFRQLDDDEIMAYVKTGEPRDKAGAYGIQGRGGVLVDRLSGSYTNVVGLPLSEVLWDLGALTGWS